jgi:CBS domain-containing protein
MGDRKIVSLNEDDFQNALREIGTYIDVSVEDLMRINRMAYKHAELRHAEQLLIRELMTPDVITVMPDTFLREAAQIMLSRRISGLPVVNHEGKLMGIVTEADFLTAMGVPAHHPSHNLWQTLESMFRHLPYTQVIPDTVGTIMRQDVITIGEDVTLHDAIQTMTRHHIKRLVVVNEQMDVRGIVTRSNLVKVFMQQLL